MRSVCSAQTSHAWNATCLRMIPLWQLYLNIRNENMFASVCFCVCMSVFVSVCNALLMSRLIAPDDYDDDDADIENDNSRRPTTKTLSAPSRHHEYYYMWSALVVTETISIMHCSIAMASAWDTVAASFIPKPKTTPHRLSYGVGVGGLLEGTQHTLALNILCSMDMLHVCGFSVRVLYLNGRAT